MLSYIFKRLLYGVLVLAGVVILVFFLFQGFGDPSRLIMGQTGDAATQSNIRKELYLDKPKWKQFLYYVNDVSPISFHTAEEIKDKKGNKISEECTVRVNGGYILGYYNKDSKTFRFVRI